MRTPRHVRRPRAVRTGRRGGFIIISELMLIGSILLIGLVIGLVTLRNTLNTEMEDFSQSIGNLNQSYAFAGLLNDNGTASTGGSAFLDAPDSNADDNGRWVFIPASANEGAQP